MGPSKNRREWAQRVCVSVCVCRGGGVCTCNRPDHSFLLTDAGPRGESWERKGEDRGAG